MTVWTILYRLRDAREGIARNAWASIATVILIALTLMLFGGFLWVNENLGQIATMLERQVQVRVFPAGDHDCRSAATARCRAFKASRLSNW